MRALREYTLAAAAEALGVTAPQRDTAFCGVNTDTRTVRPGELFVALVGPSFDGHDFVAEAAQQGAAGAVVSRAVEADFPLLYVEDTREALGRLAAARRAAFDIPVVGITGSNGKTTIKEMTAAILAQRGAVLATRGNLNNDIGMPLTLLRLADSHRYAVIEMGANHPGEIAYLTGIARPTAAVINNAGPAHLEGFGDVAGVARAKGEIFQGLADGGTAVINADDAYADLWRDATRDRMQLCFGIETTDAQVRAASIAAGAAGTQFTLITPQGSVDIALRLPGRHNVMNALAASALALAAGAQPADIKAGLDGLEAVGGRLHAVAGRGGARVIDDTYNANPASLAAALAVLAANAGTRILVLGDMGELGGEASVLHQQAGKQARAAGIDRLYGIGELSRLAVSAFGEGGRHFADHAALAQALLPELGADFTVLIKGSRSSRMERVVEVLTKC